jgi:hypothetical protein
MEMTKTNHDQVVKLPDFMMTVLRWHADKQLVACSTGRSELLFPYKEGFLHNSAPHQAFPGDRQRQGTDWD